MLLLVVVQVYIYTVQYYSAYVFPYNLSTTYGAVILFISIVFASIRVMDYPLSPALIK